MLCYVDHHDKAYAWAERRKLETHPKTGAAQLVEIRETVKEVIVPVYVQAELPVRPKPPLFADNRWRIICPPKLRRRCWRSRRVANRAGRSRSLLRRILSIIPMPSAVSA